MKYSSNKITKAGLTILSSTDKEEYSKAVEVINDWRSLHLPVLDELKTAIITLLLRKNIRIYLVSHRLKRFSSIQNKLDRNPQSKLGTLQDIGGLRIVVPTMSVLNKALSVITENVPEHFEFTKEPVSYIETPKKTSGYRSVHFVYKYHSNNRNLDGLKIELQLRTKLQHSWAMAVETAELITNSALKASQGDKDWMDFFKIASSLFAIKEQSPILEEYQEKGYDKRVLMKELYRLNIEHKFNDKLKAISFSTNFAKRDKYKDGYYILNINFELKTVRVKAFPKDNEREASEFYSRIEKGLDERKNAVVLVSVPKIQELQKAYPSYFLDTTYFLREVDNLMQDCKRFGFV